MTSSTSGLEREAERQRAEMAETAERLRAKLTPGQLLDEVSHTFRDGDLNAALGNLKTQVRDNPLALALVGAGLAWLMAGGTSSTSHARSAHSVDFGRLGTGNGNGSTGLGEKASSAMHRAGDGLANLGSQASSTGAAAGEALSSGLHSASDMASSVGSSMSHAASSASHMAHDAGSAMSDAATSAANMARDAGKHTRDALRTMEDDLASLFDREPLVLGAIGLAIGATAGALLPSTRFEKEHLGDIERKLGKAGMQAAKNAKDAVQQAAGAAGRAALDEADRQGLVPGEEGKPLADKVGDVVSRASEEAREALRGSPSEKSS